MNCVLQGISAPRLPGLEPGQTFGVDFGWSGVSAATAKSLGARFGASYFSNDASKNWTRALVNSYHAAGLGTVAVWETSANRAEGTRTDGVADANAAKAQAAAVGNTSDPIEFAVDCDCAGASLLAYFQGVHSVLGARDDAYGGHDQVLFLYQHKVVGNENWQTYAWSSLNGVTQWLPASIAPLEQYLNGSAFDNDRALLPNYGQWPSVKVAPAVIGGRQHYEDYPADAPAKPRRERESVRGWDTGNGSGARCMRPVRRKSCGVTRSHLIYDLQRDQALLKRDSKRQRDALHLPGRIQGLSHRINNRRGIVNRWL